MSNSLGSYYVSLGMQADHDSFNKAKQSSDNVSNSIARLVGTVRNSSAIIAAGLGALSVGAASTAAKNIEAASAMGISAKALKDWGTVARLAGKDVKGFQNEMAGLSEKFTMEKNGHGDAIGSVYTHFGQLLQRAKETTSEFNGMSTEVWRKMDTGEQTRLVFRMAQAVKDQQSAAMHIQNILGSTGASLYTYMKTSGKSIDGMLKEARKISFYDEEKAQKAAGFSDELSRTGAAGKNIAEALGVSIGAELTPVLGRLNDFLYNNKDTIKKTLDTIADKVGKIADFVLRLGGGVVETASGVGEIITGINEGDGEKIKEGYKKAEKQVSDGLNAIGFANGDVAQAKLTVQDYFDKNKKYRSAKEYWKETEGQDLYKRIGHFAFNEHIEKWDESELPPEIQELVNLTGGQKAWSQYIKPKGSIHDGIIRPNGQVTQVAPDDWVFAVRDIGNLSNALAPQKEPRLAMRSWDALLEEMQQGVKEFIPSTTVHNTTNAPQHITIQINQTVTSPSNDWLPQTIKEQAYTGTYDALQQAMRESRQRLELMTGIR